MTTSKGARAGAAKRSSKTAKKKPRKKKSPIVVKIAPLFTRIAVAAGDGNEVLARVYGLDVYGRVWLYLDTVHAGYGRMWERLPIDVIE